MKKAVEFFQKNMFFVIIALVGLAYILTGTSNISPTGESVGSIIASSGLGTILGWLISAMFGQQAITDGYDNEDVVNATNELANTIESVDDSINNLEMFCEIDNEQVMIRKRTRILKKVGLDPKVLETITKKDYRNYTKRQKRAIKKAYKIGYGYISSDWLLSDIEESDEKNEKPDNVNKYSALMNVRNLITKAITGIIGGLYMLEPFTKANWNIIIWRLFFFATWLVFGYVRYITDYNYITKTYRKTILKKTNKLVSFRSSLVENPEWYNITNDNPIIGNPKKDNLLTKAIYTESKEGEAEYGNIIEPIPET